MDTSTDPDGYRTVRDPARSRHAWLVEHQSGVVAITKRHPSGRTVPVYFKTQAAARRAALRLAAR